MMLAMNSCKNNNSATKFSSTSGKKITKIVLASIQFCTLQEIHKNSEFQWSQRKMRTKETAFRGDGWKSKPLC